MIRLFAAQEGAITRKKSLTHWRCYCNRSIVQPSPEQSMPNWRWELVGAVAVQPGRLC